MLATVSLVDIYTHMIGGSFPHGDTVDPARTVLLIAEDLLGTQQVHLTTAVGDGTVYYLAVPSKALASHAEFACPLAAALPGHPGHAGDGAYVHWMQSHAAAVLRRGTELNLLVGLAEEVMDAIKAAELVTIDVSQAPGEVLRAPSWHYRMLATRAANYTSTLSLAVLGLAGVTYLASQALIGYVSAGEATRAQTLATQANAAIEAAQLTQPLGKQVHRITALSTLVVKTGGWIDGYQVTNGSGERFVISLPSWVTADVIREMGDGVRTELQAADNLVWAIKADAAGNTVPGMGPVLVGITSARAGNR